MGFELYNNNNHNNNIILPFVLVNPNDPHFQEIPFFQDLQGIQHIQVLPVQDMKTDLKFILCPLRGSKAPEFLFVFIFLKLKSLVCHGCTYGAFCSWQNRWMFYVQQRGTRLFSFFSHRNLLRAQSTWVVPGVPPWTNQAAALTTDCTLPCKWTETFILLISCSTRADRRDG